MRIVILSQIHAGSILADLVQLVRDLKTTKNVGVGVQMDFKEIPKFLVNLFLIPVVSPSNAELLNEKVKHTNQMLIKEVLCIWLWFLCKHTCPEASMQLSELVKRSVNRFLVQFVYILRDCKD